jgi:serine/threonine-protein kinase
MSGVLVKPRQPIPSLVGPESARCTWSAGEVVADRYRLVSILGEGAMGWVWRAHNMALGFDVAIKLLRKHRPDEEADERDVTGDQAAERLVLEARAVARLEHPGIVRVYDFGETKEGLPFFVMELLEGDSLASILDLRGRMPELAAVQLMLPVAGALTVAHAGGVVHRDLKPDNILIVPLDGEGARQPKIVDFGIARLSGSGSKRLTAIGAVIGTPGYMAPEQTRGEPDIDGRADVFSFCVLLYELITGAVPFPGVTPGDYILSLYRGTLRSTVDAVGGDPELWAILARGLAIDRDARWQSVADLRAALIDWAMAKGARIDVTGTALALRARGPSSRPPRMDPPRTTQGAAPLPPPAEATIAAPLPAAIAPPPPRRRASVLIALGVLALITLIGIAAAVAAVR